MLQQAEWKITYYKLLPVVCLLDYGAPAFHRMIRRCKVLRMNSPKRTVNLEALARLDEDVERIQRSLRATHDMRAARAFLLLGKASLENEPLTTQDLARLLDLAAQTAHNTVQQFVAEGLVVKRRYDLDARVKHLVLTEKGVAVLKEVIGC